MSKKPRARRVEISELEFENDKVSYHQQSDKKGFFVKNIHKLNDAHNSFLNLCLYEKTKMVLVDGPAGTAKTYLAVLAGLTLLKDAQVEQIVYIRSIVESASKSIGALPGEIDEKFGPWVMPMVEKLNELLPPQKGANLISEGSIRCLPVNFVRGLTFHKSFVIIDEAQNMTREELVTILTRFGQNSRYVVVGDSNQRDIGKFSGFADVYTRFNDEDSANHGIHVCKFGENEIVRSPILKFIVKKLGA